MAILFRLQISKFIYNDGGRGNPDDLRRMIYDELLQRIGRKRPKYFAVIDFTSGYHQAPIAADTIPYTAFVTHRGVYEWIRLPMGLKGAPSYFQREVASILGGLIGIICELYFDDLIIFGDT